MVEIKKMNIIKREDIQKFGYINIWYLSLIWSLASINICESVKIESVKSTTHEYVIDRK